VLRHRDKLGYRALARLVMHHPPLPTRRLARLQTP
jgi:hypothetical protein